MPRLSYLDVSSNGLQSPLPEFLQEQPPMNVDLRRNNFTCPNPSWCTAPPIGNGRCEPCHDERDNLLCCMYSVSGSTKPMSLCTLDQACPEVVGLELISATPVLDCSKCVEAKRRSRSIDEVLAGHGKRGEWTELPEMPW